MDQVKIGQFIAGRRKAHHLTQAQLAEKLGITDRAVSKWETGRSLPDASIMLELCGILEITVNELLCGEVIAMDEYREKMEQNLLGLVKQKEDSDRKMLMLEICIGLMAVLALMSMVFLASFVQMADWLRILLIVLGFVLGMSGILCALRIEQTAGYYQCVKCGHKYVPTYSSVLWAMHVNRTRYMRCHNCHVRSWQKKVLAKD